MTFLVVVVVVVVFFGGKLIGFFFEIICFFLEICWKVRRSARAAVGAGGRPGRVRFKARTSAMSFF